MNELTSNVNWLAVIVGAILAYGLGAIWYSTKLFGKKWAEGVGIDINNADGQPTAAMIVQAMGTFLLAWIIGITATSNSLLTAILITLTIAILLISGGLYSQKSCAAIIIEGSYVIAMVVIMIICQGIF